MKNNKLNRKPRNRIAIFYKRTGVFVGPWGGVTFSKKDINKWRKDGTLKDISNYILHSPLQLRRRVA